MLRVTAGHDIEYPLRSAGSAVAYYLQDGKEPPGVWAGTAAGALGLTGQVDPEVYRNLFGKLIAPTGERLYSGRPPRYACETGRDKEEEAAAAVAALGEFATPAEARRTQAKVLGSTGAAVPFYDLTFPRPSPSACCRPATPPPAQGTQEEPAPQLVDRGRGAEVPRMLTQRE